MLSLPACSANKRNASHQQQQVGFLVYASAFVLASFFVSDSTAICITIYLAG